MKRGNYKKSIILLLLFCLIFLVSCTKKIYVVVFDYNYNNIISSQEVKKGEKAIKPVDPSRTNYNFLGWYEDSNFSVLYNENRKITNNTTFYAKWEAINTYTIRFNTNGGRIKQNSDEIEFVDKSEVIIPVPTKTNYTFLGWYENGKLVEEINENKDYFLYAKYRPNCTSVPALIMSPVRESAKIYTNLTYKISGGNELKMDLYLPPLDEGESCPILFMYYGGGFILGDKSQAASINGNGYFQEVFDYVLDHNIAVAIPNYSLSNGSSVTFPYPVEDVLDSIRFCVKNRYALGIDVNNMGVLGYSAGAYMALMAAFAKNSFVGDPDLKNYYYDIKYVIEVSGPSFYEKDILSVIAPRGLIMLSTFLGDIMSEDDFSYVMPSYYVSEAKPDVLIIHGKQDDLVPFSQTEKFDALLKEKGINSTVLAIEGANHSYNLVKGYDKLSMSMMEINEYVSNYIMNEVNKK